MSPDEPTTTEYIYTGNNDPANTSTAIVIDGETYQIGDVVPLTDEQFQLYSQHFSFDDGTGEPAVVEPAQQEDPGFASGGLQSTPPATLPSEAVEQAEGESATSDPGDILGESQNASGSSKS